MYGAPRLLRSQRNALFEVVRESGMPPADFVIVPTAEQEATIVGGMTPRLVYQPRGLYGGYYLEISPVRPDLFNIEMSPGNAMMVEAYSLSAWEEVLAITRVWLEILQREVAEPDLWEGLLGGEAGEIESVGSNHPFTQEEIAGIRMQVEAARGYLEGLQLEPDRMADANAKLDYLIAAADRLGRFDWRQVAAGIVVSIGMSAAFNPERARTLYQLLVEPVQRLLGA